MIKYIDTQDNAILKRVIKLEKEELRNAKPVETINYQVEFEKLAEKVNKLRDVKEVQGYQGNWNYDNYMCGLYNGLELAMCIIENREPEFKSLK